MGMADMGNGAWWSLVAIAGLAGAKVLVARRGNGALRRAVLAPKFAYCVSYETVSGPEEGDEEPPEPERGYKVDGWKVQIPDGLYGPAFSDWAAEQGINMELTGLDVDDLDQELGYLEEGEAAALYTKLPKAALAAIEFGRICRGAYATNDDSGGAWWSTNPEEDYRTGESTTESYHPCVALEPYVLLIHAIIKKDRPMIGHLVRRFASTRS